MQFDEREFANGNSNGYSSKKKSLMYKRLLLLLGIIGVFTITIFGIKAYQVSKVDPFFVEGSTLAQDYFLESARSYYNFDPSALPSATGMCSTVSLRTIQAQELISDIKYYDTCDKDGTLVRTCKLASGDYQFEVSMSCENNTSTFAYATEMGEYSDTSSLKRLANPITFEYKLEAIKLDNVKVLELTTVWADENPYVDYKVVKEETYYRYRDKEWKYSGDIKYFYPQDKNLSEEVEEYYVESPKEGYVYKEVTSNYAYKWYLQNGETGVKHYYPSGSTDIDDENTYYLVAPVKGAKREESTKVLAAKYYRVESTKESDYLAYQPSKGATKIAGTERWGNWSSYSLEIPKVAPYGQGNREIEKRTKLYVLPYQGLEENTEITWEPLTDYVSSDEAILSLRALGYDINNLEDVLSYSNLKYSVLEIK